MLIDYTKEQQLLEKFAEFQNQTGEKALEQFALWLLGEKTKSERPNLAANSKINGYIAMLITFMSRYSNFYTRRLFANTEVYSIDDFAVLLVLREQGYMTKTQLFKSSIMEKSYGTEVLRRLYKQGMIVETESSTDRRSKLVSISEYGLEILNKYESKLNNVANHVVAKLSEDDKLKLVQILQYLHQYHYEFFTSKPETEILDLINSKANHEQN